MSATANERCGKIQELGSSVVGCAHGICAHSRVRKKARLWPNIEKGWRICTTDLTLERQRCAIESNEMVCIFVT